MNIRITLSATNLYKFVSDYDIFKYYCPGFNSVGEHFTSPFRNDKNASAIIYANKQGQLKFNDFVKQVMSGVGFVQELYSLTFVEALVQIAKDFKLEDKFYMADWGGRIINSLNNEAPKVYNKVIEPSGASVIKVKRREWQHHDIQFWNKVGVTLDILNLFKVSPVSHIWIENNKTTMLHAKSYAYVYDYYWEDGIFRRKIYQPYSKTKWISNGGKVVQGEGVLPYSGDLLIITKSLKDVMTLYSLGYTAIAPTTEKTFPSIDYINKQRHRFKEIVLFLDNDETGKLMSEKHSLSYDIPYILIQDKYKTKDISDFYKEFGRVRAGNLMEELIRNKDEHHNSPKHFRIN